MPAAAPTTAKKTFKVHIFRGVELDDLMKVSQAEFIKMCTSRTRRRFRRGLGKKSAKLIKKLLKSKKDVPVGEKPTAVKTHLRNMIVTREMINSIVGVHNGQTFNEVEIKPEMLGHYLGEFALPYKPVKHGTAGVGATRSSRFIPLK